MGFLNGRCQNRYLESRADDESQAESTNVLAFLRHFLRGNLWYGFILSIKISSMCGSVKFCVLLMTHYHSNIQGWLDVGCCFLFVCLKEINTVMHYIDQK